MTVVRRIARPLLAAVFVVAGLDAVRHPGGKANVASPLLDKLGPMLGLPDDKEMLVRANGAAQLVGGALLATGRLPRVGGLLIAASLIPTTLALTTLGSRAVGDPVNLEVDVIAKYVERLLGTATTDSPSPTSSPQETSS